MVTQHKFSCLLFGRREEGPVGTSCYCMGQFKGEEAVVKAMAGKFTEGTVVKLSKVTFDGAVDASYIHTPKQVAIDLKRTLMLIMSPVELQQVRGVNVGKHVIPPRSVAETSMITSNKAIDVLAIVRELSFEILQFRSSSC